VRPCALRGVERKNGTGSVSDLLCESVNKL
jgi:hypothetical protein